MRELVEDSTPEQTAAVLGAMRRVASAAGTGPITDADRAALVAAHHYVFRHDGELDVDALAEPSPADLAAAIPGRALAEHAAQFLVVMALVDGTADEAKIAVVQEHAKALRVHDDAVRQLTELGRQNLQWVAADVARQNLRSITGHVVHSSIDDWILPYRGDHADPELAARYAALDSTHVLSGYDTSPQGELLVSTFTAGMHPHEPMSGHILPVIISWHLGIELAKFAGSVHGALDPEKFWVAWSRGGEVTTDVFATDSHGGAMWDFWGSAGRPLDDLRADYTVPALDPADAADGVVPDWYHASA